MLKIKVLLVLICLGLYSNQTFALSKLGHQLVCQLSYQHLSPSKQSVIDALLSKMPESAKEVINQYNYLPKDNAITFANACTWADAIKKNDKFDQYKPWHYINLSRETKTVDANVCLKNCLPQAIINHKNKLQKSKSLWPKTQALMFLGHWLGDIHQPLHVSFVDDLGGNKVKVNSKDGKCTNLHWLWDSCLLSRQNLTNAQWLTTLEKLWSKTSNKENVNDEMVWQWAGESFNIVLRRDFLYCQQNQNKCIAYDGVVDLPADYQKKFSPILQSRIVSAAKRLTQLLELSL